MPLTPVIDMAKMEKYTDTPKFGTVVDNNDPDMLGKVKVLIPGIMEAEDPAALPWVRRKQDTAFCGANCEIFDVPEIGSIVEVRWNYDENTPMYSGAPMSKKHTSGIFTHNYPYEGGIKFGKMYIKFDKGTNLLTISNGKAFIVCDPMGNISLTSAGNLDLTCNGDCNINAINTNVKGNMRVDGDLWCAKGGNGTVSALSAAAVSGGIIRMIE